MHGYEVVDINPLGPADRALERYDVQRILRKE
jgi:hypothetical protein